MWTQSQLKVVFSYKRKEGRERRKERLLLDMKLFPGHTVKWKRKAQKSIGCLFHVREKGTRKNTHILAHLCERNPRMINQKLKRRLPIVGRWERDRREEWEWCQREEGRECIFSHSSDSRNHSSVFQTLHIPQKKQNWNQSRWQGIPTWNTNT